ncbi:WD40 repeat protein [Ciceribacter lividus]|uniref:WD40 repeat protein n=1 Tax=Ciceribacter lividus TaxID=1197950 RepID=A0A6I7HTG0_9HYPH|nr:TolB family protein [Ciceribacter lividus]RCW28508.1 WD40 repeat protein [Ciceribacter lividus]
MRSSVEIFDCEARTSRVVWQTEALVEAPNWTPDGGHLVINGDGLIYRVPIDGSAVPERIETGFAGACNNDHGLSPDGTMLAISDKTEHGKSCIYVLPAAGGVPRQVTARLPSYWHGWSPDGRQLAYCGIRDGEFGIYTVSVDGGEERELIRGGGHNDGPDYSPDGQWIYFNSDRSGLMQIWKIRPDGSELAQVTDDGFSNWFPHPGPRGDVLVFLSYAGDVEGHPRDKQVSIRRMDVATGEVETLLNLFGGQGSLNVPSWSPDGDAFAYVRYFPVE